MSAHSMAEIGPLRLPSSRCCFRSLRHSPARGPDSPLRIERRQSGDWRSQGRRGPPHPFEMRERMGHPDLLLRGCYDYEKKMKLIETEDP
jgi:hypothetical protein